MALLVSNKSLLQPSTDVAMLFAPFGFIHPPPPVLPFLPKQNVSLKEFARSEIMKKISGRTLYICNTVPKELTKQCQLSSNQHHNLVNKCDMI